MNEIHSLICLIQYKFDRFYKYLKKYLTQFTSNSVGFAHGIQFPTQSVGNSFKLKSNSNENVSQNSRPKGGTDSWVIVSSTSTSK